MASEGGVWRTVGGRRIFIKDGEDLSTAMKNSGKFKGSKKENSHDSRKEIKYYLEKGEFEKFDKAIEEYGLDDEREEFLEGTNRRIAADYQEHKMKQEYMRIPEKERVQAYVDGKNWKDLVKEKGTQKITKNGKEYNVVEHKEESYYKGSSGPHSRSFMEKSPERYRIENPKDPSDWGWIDKAEYERLKRK